MKLGTHSLWPPATTLVAGLAAQKMQILGAGATFPTRSIEMVSGVTSCPNIKINYQPLGSAPAFAS